MNNPCFNLWALQSILTYPHFPAPQDIPAPQTCFSGEVQESMWPISAGTELSPAFIVLCSSFNAFLMEFSEGEHRQPSSAGMGSVCSVEAG